MPAGVALSTLPALTPEQAAHGARVTALLRDRIEAAGGWLAFDGFMEFALYEPGYGYYSAGAAKFGAGGDFTTAPESSELFSRCLAGAAAQVLGEIPGGRGEILEIGAGSGRMAAAILAELAQRGQVPSRYRILELSADLRERQRARLAALPASLAARVEWLERWPQQPLEGVVLANEVLDALPCERFTWRAAGVSEVGVGVDGQGGLRLEERPAGAALAEAVRAIVAELPQPLPEGYRSELCLRLRPWTVALGAVLGRGALLLFDYGLPRAHYYLPERVDGTLTCHFRHRAHGDALRHPGLQDITAWVDFTAVAEAAVEAGLEVAGFTTQAAFLLASGIEARVAAAPDERSRLALAAEAKRLLLPGEMGEAFKAIALTRGLAAAPAAFALQDLRRSL